MTIYTAIEQVLNSYEATGTRPQDLETFQDFVADVQSDLGIEDCSNPYEWDKVTRGIYFSNYGKKLV